METKEKMTEKLSQSITLKAMIIGILTLLMLIPGVIIQDLIRERQARSNETIEKINSKWSNAQTVVGPVLSIPYTYSYIDAKKNEIKIKHVLTITPEDLKITSNLFPEERHYGIYTSILYKSDMVITGSFPKVDFKKINYTIIHWDEANIRIGITDLRGLSNIPDFILGDKHFTAEAGGDKNDVIGQGLLIKLNSTSIIQNDSTLKFSCHLNLNGSSNLNFVPVAKNTTVDVMGAWQSPGFTGSFSPVSTIDKNGFTAHWNILHFNRNIPDYWLDDTAESFEETVFGVDLIDTVDHYQQNMRSAKYSLMFIVLTFVVFFFIEIISKKRIHPVQYLLVGIALILFYSLLLSISEQLNFGWAYLIASFATITLISTYAGSIFKNKTQTGILTVFLTVLYVFLYIVLQLEDVALLIGSIGLFIILGLIMYFSKKINWYKTE